MPSDQAPIRKDGHRRAAQNHELARLELETKRVLLRIERAKLWKEVLGIVLRALGIPGAILAVLRIIGLL
jgi:hypothetical protein